MTRIVCRSADGLRIRKQIQFCIRFVFRVHISLKVANLPAPQHHYEHHHYQAFGILILFHFIFFKCSVRFSNIPDASGLSFSPIFAMCVCVCLGVVIFQRLPLNITAQIQSMAEFSKAFLTLQTLRSSEYIMNDVANSRSQVAKTSHALNIN